MVLLSPLGKFADMSILNKQTKLRQIKDVCTLYAGVSLNNQFLILPYENSIESLLNDSEWALAP